MPDQSHRPSRRTLLRTGAAAAWTAPVIVAATSVPAFAASNTTPLALSPGGTRLTPQVQSPYWFPFIATEGLAVTSSVALSAGSLHLVGSQPAGLSGYSSAVTSGAWTLLTYQYARSFDYVYGPAVSEGETVRFSDEPLFCQLQGPTPAAPVSWNLAFVADGVSSNPLVFTAP